VRFILFKNLFTLIVCFLHYYIVLRHVVEYSWSLLALKCNYMKTSLHILYYDNCIVILLMALKLAEIMVDLILWA